MLLIIAACGIGTFLLRWLPLWHARRRGPSQRRRPVLRTWLAGIGPAAICALLILSIWGVVAPDARPEKMLHAALALVTVIVSRWILRGGVALPTLLGAAAYGLLSHPMGVTA